VKVYSASESSGKISSTSCTPKEDPAQAADVRPGDRRDRPPDKIIKGYEFAKDQYVVFSEEELDQPRAGDLAVDDITEFVPLESVDPLYFESGYYLGGKGRRRPFKLADRRDGDMKHAAVAKYVSRGQNST